MAFLNKIYEYQGTIRKEGTCEMSRTTYLILPDLKIVKLQLIFSHKHSQAVLELTCFNYCACVIDSFNLLHLRRQHFVGGQGSKIGQICQQIVIKNFRQKRDGVKNHKNLPTSSMDGPLHIAIEQKALCMICGVIHKLC